MIPTTKAPGRYYFHGMTPPQAEWSNYTYGTFTHPQIGDVETATWRAVGVAAMGAAVYHGYKRNHSIGWAIGWGFAAAFFPIITTGVALAQGFAKPKGR